MGSSGRAGGGGIVQSSALLREVKGNVGATATIEATAGARTHTTMTLTAVLCTVTITGTADGLITEGAVRVTQDGVGGRTIVFDGCDTDGNPIVVALEAGESTLLGYVHEGGDDPTVVWVHIPRVGPPS